MNQDTNDKSAADTAANAENARAAAERQPGDSNGDAADHLAKLEAELSETKDRLLRALAEAENQRRRAQREREDAQRYAASSFAKDLLDVADNLRRALASLDPGELGDERVKAMVEGVAATERALLQAFERHGIRIIDPRPGDPFDVNLHQAMFEVETTEHPAGAIAQVLQTGYRMHDRLLRPALVGVAKASARPGQVRVDQRV